MRKGLAILTLLAVFPPFVSAQTEALDDVNAIRAANGLVAYKYDEGLTQAAKSASVFRAQQRLFGHTSNDFQFLPAGSAADAAGCAAYPPSSGWFSCAVFDDYQYAGAAYAIGTDGKAYCHLFVRGGSGRTLGQRVSFNRPLVAHLKAAVNRLKPAPEKPAETETVYETRYVQQCQGGTCRLVPIQVPVTKPKGRVDTGFSIQGAAKPLPAGPTPAAPVKAPAVQVDFAISQRRFHPLENLLRFLPHRPFFKGRVFGGGCRS